jgi:probable HAF family extracellular repeat protein
VNLMRIASLLLLATLCAGQSNIQGWEIRYDVVPIESERLPYVGATFANDISDAGWTTGFIYPNTGGYRTTFTYHPSVGFIDLGTIPGYGTEGLGINDRGEISGVVTRTGGQASFVYAPGTGFTILGDFGGQEVNAGTQISASGVVAGTIESADGRFQAYRYSASSGVQHLGTLGGDNSRGYAINDIGWVVGTSQTGDGSWHAFLYRDDMGMVDLGPGYASGINNLGVAAGISDGQPVLFRDGAIIPLGNPFGLTYVSDINDLGMVVGGYFDQQGLPQTFVATEADGLINLNGLIAPEAGWLVYANAINNSGQIAGTLSYNDTVWAAVATPIPEPSTWAVLALGSGLVWLCRRNRG